MRKIKLIVDQVSDLSEEYAKQNNIDIIPMTYILDDKEYDNINVKHMEVSELYQKMREGKSPKTSQVNVETAKDYYAKNINAGYDCIYLTCSSGISGTINSAKIAKEMLMEENLITEKNKDYKVLVIDSLSASLGYGMLAIKVNNLIKEGKNLEEIEQEIKKLIPTICHYFTVGDLAHLARTGRISKSKAFIGGILNLKPVLYVNNEGQLKSIDKVKGRKKAIKSLVDYMEGKLIKEKNTEIYISHGDCNKDVKLLKSLIQKRFGFNSFTVNLIGPVVGSHSGPDTLALFFVGKNRDEKEI